MPANDLDAVLRELSQPGHPNDMHRRAALCRQALELIQRTQNPPRWAALQRHLGNSLSKDPQGEQADNLESAIQHYEAALTVYTHEAFPEQWAEIQNNLGNALRALGEREWGIARLEEAVEAYRAALQERTRERVPLQWAATHNNLGTILVEVLKEIFTGTCQNELRRKQLWQAPLSLLAAAGSRARRGASAPGNGSLPATALALTRVRTSTTRRER